jgi:hypothetical protein
MSAEITMGRVGDRVPPPGLVSDLESFDPDLRLRWNRKEQCWIVVQVVRRVHQVGEFKSGMLSQVKETERPVLYLSELKGEPDRRILPQLYRQVLGDRRARLERVRLRAKEKKDAEKKRTDERFEPAREGMENAAYELRAKGLCGMVKPSYVPRSDSAAA